MGSARLTEFSTLTGWEDEDHDVALAVYMNTVDLLDDQWPRPRDNDARAFFETQFRPVVLDDHPALLTGYYEPEVPGVLSPTEGYSGPIYSAPDDLPAAEPWYSRTEIERGGYLSGRELVWLSDPLEAFFAQVQGSVRVRLPDNTILRCGYSSRNGHAYRSIGAELIRRGSIPAEKMSAETIRQWCQNNPEKVPDLLRHNPSFVFFRKIDLPPDAGPLGAMGRSVTPMRSLAVDPDFIPLGAPVWVECRQSSRLMVAQDVGSAIKGCRRGDIFFGSGTAAGKIAGSLSDSGRLVTFFPPFLAERLVS